MGKVHKTYFQGQMFCSSHFDIKTGRVTMDPATKDVATYKVRLVGDAVEVEL
jgi:nitrite reductase/ring-hydroxylating ferredoxin subunit